MKKAIEPIFGSYKRFLVVTACGLAIFVLGIATLRTSAQKQESATVDHKTGILLSPQASVTVPGGGSSSWDINDDVITTNGLPAGGGCSNGAAGSGAAINDASIPAGGDAFDDGGMIWVNNTQVGGALTQVGNTVNFAPVTIAGLNTNMQYYIASNSATARIMVTMTNPTGGTITVPVNYATNAGSDGGTIIRASSNGNTTFEIADRWVVSSDASDGDAVNTTVLFGPGSPAITPTSVSTTVFDCAATNGFLANYSVSVPPGATRSLMFFQKLNDITPNAVSEAPTFFDTNPPPAGDLLSGLTPIQLGQIANWAFAPPPCNTYASATTAGQSIVPGTVDIGNHADDGTTTIALPFPVNFYGNNFSSANVSSNGNLQFTSNSAQFGNDPLPTTNMNNLIAPLWDDLRTDQVGGGVFTSVSGSAPNRIFNIEWRTVYFGTSTTANFEARLYESGPIEFVYGNLNGTGDSATVGLQKGDGSGGAANFNQFSFNTASLSNGLKITYSCGAGAVTVNVPDTVVPAGQVDPVPVVLNALGGEKTVSFSLNYATNPFANNPTAVCGSSNPGCTVTVNNATPGQIGVTVVNAGTFNPGPREVARVLFQTLPNGNLASTPLTVGDVPTPRAVLLASNAALPSTFTGGRVVFANGLEGDIAGRNTGNGTVDTSDVTIERQFIVGSITPDPTFNEAQRADVSPAVVKGDGQLDSTDLVQLRRYAAGIDGTQSAGGFNGAPPPSLTAAPQPEKGFGGNRAMRVVPAMASPGSRVTVPVEIDADGSEIAASFTLNYDASRLGNPVVSLGGNAGSDAVLTTNTIKAGEGKLGVLVDSTASLAKQVVIVTFDVAAAAPEGETSISFSDLLATRGISDAGGNRLSTRYYDGTVTISGPGQASVGVSGRVLTPDGRGVRNAQVTITDQNGAARTVTTSSFGYYSFDGVAAGGVYTLNVASRQFRFAARTVQVSDNLTNVDLVGLD